MSGDQAAMQPETFANPMVRQMLGNALTLPQRAIDASAQDVQHLGEPNYQRQSIGPALEAATNMMGGAGGISAEANTLRTGLKLRGNQAPQLVVARKMPDGTVRFGKPGQIHVDLMTTKELGAASDSPEVASSMGYANSEGKFLNRDEALKFAMQNEPKRAAWSAQQPEFGLDAATYGDR